MPKTIKEMQDEIGAWSVSKGFWERPRASGEVKDDHPFLAMKIALSHSELSEALEEMRSGNPNFYISEEEEGKPEGLGVELADAVIRILDLASHLEIDLGEMIEIKMAYNQGRPYMHGRKF